MKNEFKIKKLKCFIACAFNRDDVDSVYKKIISPILKTLNIVPFRADKPDHNYDIDDRIIDLIKASDFCICDLTYARPSVYYEAGYAAGLNKPVIFIVKKDHFELKTDDPFGNFRVHFDLQMKNIIGWKNENDKNFEKKLKYRISLVTKPISIYYKKSFEKENEDRIFNNLSEKDKYSAIENKLVSILKKKRYKIKKPYLITVRNVTIKCIPASANKKILFLICPVLTRNIIFYHWLHYRNVYLNKDEIKDAVQIFISANFSRLQFSNLLPEFSKLNQNQYYSERKDGIKEYVTIIHGIKSLIDFEKDIIDSI